MGLLWLFLTLDNSQADRGSVANATAGIQKQTDESLSVG